MHQLPVQLRHKEFYSIGAGQYFVRSRVAAKSMRWQGVSVGTSSTMLLRAAELVLTLPPEKVDLMV